MSMTYKKNCTLFSTLTTNTTYIIYTRISLNHDMHHHLQERNFRCAMPTPWQQPHPPGSLLLSVGTSLLLLLLLGGREMVAAWLQNGHQLPVVQVVRCGRVRRIGRKERRARVSWRVRRNKSFWSLSLTRELECYMALWRITNRRIF